MGQEEESISLLELRSGTPSASEQSALRLRLLQQLLSQDLHEVDTDEEASIPHSRQLGLPYLHAQPT
jgi:hypothetical protein